MNPYNRLAEKMGRSSVKSCYQVTLMQEGMKWKIGHEKSFGRQGHHQKKLLLMSPLNQSIISFFIADKQNKYGLCY